MDKTLFDQLNQVYAPLRGRAIRLTQALSQRGMDAKWGWYANHSVEVCGVENYLMDFYHAGMDISGIAARIAESTEQAVNTALAFPAEVELETLLSAVEDCRRWKSGNEA